MVLPRQWWQSKIHQRINHAVRCRFRSDLKIGVQQECFLVSVVSKCKECKYLKNVVLECDLRHYTVTLRRQVTVTISHQWTDACCLHVVSIWVKYINEISIKWFMIVWGLQLALGQLISIRNGQNSGNHHSWKGEWSMEVSVLAFIIYVVYMIELLELVSLNHTLWIKYKKCSNLLKKKYTALWICIKTTHQFQNLLLTK